MRYETIQDLIRGIEPALRVTADGVEVVDRDLLVGEHLEPLVFHACVPAEADIRSGAQWIIREAARALGIHLSSIQGLYAARGRGDIRGGFTVPAVNIRGLTFDTARALLRSAKKLDTTAILFEIARSEMGYTEQRPSEYTASVLAAAIAEGHTGPIFLQGDHFQLKAKGYAADPEKETAGVRELCDEAVAAGFYNIDIDSSTLVDLEQPTLPEQQHHNALRCAELTAHLRKIQPEGIEISVGGEIGEVGSQNSTVEELQAYVTVYRQELDKLGEGLVPISKVSVQTGTSHGGVPLPDGTVADVALDFDVLRDLSRMAREEFGMAGAVQHGASTLPDEAFHKFAEMETAEVHLATGFQNILLDHEAFPATLRDMAMAWIDTNCAAERKEGWSAEQFHYKLRKKIFGPFKAHFFALDREIKDTLMAALEAKFDYLNEQLGIRGTRELVEQTVTCVDVPAPCPEAVKTALEGGIPAAVPDEGVASAPNEGVAAVPDEGVAAAPDEDVAAPPDDDVASLPDDGLA